MLEYHYFVSFMYHNTEDDLSWGNRIIKSTQLLTSEQDIRWLHESLRGKNVKTPMVLSFQLLKTVNPTEEE